LIEVLLASAIGAMVMGALVMALYQVSEVSRGYQDIMDTSQQLQAAAALLSRDAVSAAAASSSVEPATLTLQIPTFVDFYGQVGDPVTQTIRYDYKSDDGTLVRTLVGAPSSSLVVARRLTGVTFSTSDTIDGSGIITAAVTAEEHGRQAQTTLVFQRRPGR
jgi:hypothetical protein